MLKRLLDGIAARRELEKFELQNPTAAKVRTLMPKCLVCNAGPAAHRCAQVASTPCNQDTKSRVVTLFRHVKNHEWESLKDFREFRADQDDAIAYAVIGPHEGGVVILTRDPADLYSRVEIYREEKITAEEVERIKSLVPADEWTDL